MSEPAPHESAPAAPAAGTALRAHENRLAREKSPYLLQHARNPVDWYPWGEEAFARAREQGKPIFLSIGYSTCHWCHVMERESFENDAIAELLNRDFVAIKVDREERPDVDRIYMTAMQAMGMGGGWPLTAFLTPDLKPFFGGTYFPPDTRAGHVGMTELLPRVREAWTTRRADVEQTGAQVFEALDGLSRADGAAAPSATLFAECVRSLERSFDADEGGFGRAPKFPSTPNLAFLVRWWMRDPEGRTRARDMVLKQLDAMRAGGIHDHLGGGFHRYSTDAEWLVPHFEKMLYDQALIAEAYLDGWQITGDDVYAGTARDLFAYVMLDLSSEAGGFFSAEDADSEGEEGRFYVWRPDELRERLGDDDAALFAHRYGVTPQGNFEHGASVLHEAHTLEATAAAFQVAPAAAAERLDAARRTLLDARGTRVRPHRDDKVLAAWNGLMIAAFARGGRVLGDASLVARAARAAEFVWTALWDASAQAMHRRWRDGDVAAAGQLDDYAYVAHGMLGLFGATHDPRWLERAAALTEAQIARFWDEAGGAFFESPEGDPSIGVRMKDGFDGAELAGNSVAAANLLRLSGLLERPAWRALAERTLAFHRRRLAGNAWAMPQMLVAMDLASAPTRHVVVAGERDAADTRALLAAFEKRFRPTDELILVDEASRAALATLAPFTSTLTPRDGRATGTVCVDHACRLPATDAVAFARELDAPIESRENR